MIDFNTRPSEQRGFIHKKIFAAVLDIIGKEDGTGPGAGGGGGGSPRPSKFSPEQLAGTLDHLRHGHTAVDTGHGWLRPELIRQARASVVSGPVPSGIPPGHSFLPPGTGACVPPLRRDPRTGDCRFFLGDQTGVDDTPVGEAVMGRFGPALIPGSKVIDRQVCPRGMVLGSDFLCYNSRGEGKISNKNRLWPKGAQPLGTAEEMRAVRIAARFGRRFETTTKRLQKIGVVKKPAPRARARARRQIGPGSGITVIDTE